MSNDEDFSVDLTAADYGDVEGLPDENEELGVEYIVSSMVLEAEPYREDLLVPDGVVRDADGQVEYCTRFRIR